MRIAVLLIFSPGWPRPRAGLRGDGQVTAEDLIAFAMIVNDASTRDADADASDVPEGETSLVDDVLSFVQVYAEGCP